MFRTTVARNWFRNPSTEVSAPGKAFCIHTREPGEWGRFSLCENYPGSPSLKDTFNHGLSFLQRRSVNLVTNSEQRFSICIFDAWYDRGAPLFF